MTAKTTTTESKPRALPWGRWNEAVDRQIAARTTPESCEATYEAWLAGETTPRTVNGAPTYRDPGTSESYTVGYGGERTYSRPAAPARDFTPSDAQIRFLNALLDEREHTYTPAQIAAGRADWRKIRPMLDELKVSARRDPRARKVEVEVAPEPTPALAARLDFSAIPDGYYALRTDEGVKFYRVSTSKRNSYKNVQVQASDNLHMLFGKAGIAVLHKLVEAGLVDSQKLYAQELGRCYVCGRTLTDEESRAAGIGPICAGK